MFTDRDPNRGARPDEQLLQGAHQNTAASPHPAIHQSHCLGDLGISPDVAARLWTCWAELDGITDAATAAIANGDPLDVIDILGPLGRITDRLRVALQGVGISEERP